MQLKYLPDIKTPEDIKGYSSDQLHELCSELRNHTIETVTEVGGHLASTLGVIELSVALHYIFDTPRDKLVWDVGHQGYAHKLLTGRFKDFSTIRQYNGLSGFLKRTESEYDVFGAGHASTSISAALGIAEGRKQKQDDFRIAAIIGDGSMTGGLAFEGINNAGHLGCQLLVILNDNEMSISPNVGAISTYFTRLISNPLYNRVRNEVWELTGMIPLGKTKTRNFIRKIDESLKSLIVPGMLFHELGFRYFGPINGHDLDEVIHTLDNIKDIKTPVMLHVVTKKGKGMVSVDNKSGEYHNDALKYHAVKPNGSELPEQVENKIKKESAPIFQNVFGTLACEVARNRQDIVCITAAMKEGTGLSTYAKEFSDRYYDVGIAEGHGVTFSAGLATEGIRPITAIYSTFLQRAYDHIIHDVALQHLPVIFCMDRAGIAGEDGPTHHGALDLAYLRCIQGMIITAPKNGNEFRHLLYTALNITDQPYAIRYPKASSVEFDESGQAELIPVGSWEIEQHGSDVAILAVGTLVYTALDAALELKSSGISCEIVNCRFIKPMDTSYLESMRRKFTKVVTLEEGTIIGGFGDGIAGWLLNKGFNGQLKKLGLPDSFVEHGSRDELLSLLKLDSVGIVESIRELVGARETAAG